MYYTKSRFSIVYLGFFAGFPCKRVDEISSRVNYGDPFCSRVGRTSARGLDEQQRQQQRLGRRAEITADKPNNKWIRHRRTTARKLTYVKCVIECASGT